jgi:hypothetical protein
MPKSKMGLGYGSEYQLLRFLGRYRELFLKEIQKNIKFKGKLEILDFPVNKNLLLDNEFTDIKFLDDKKRNELSDKWNKYWPQTGNAQNWDAVFFHADEYILVEAKAHLEELKSDCKANNNESINKIEKAFAATKQRFLIDSNNSWTKKYYQFANRLAFLNFMLDNGIKCSLLNIYFINGYEKKGRDKNNDPIIVEDKSVKTEEEWGAEIKEEYKYLGISNNDEVLKYISEVYIDCKNYPAIPQGINPKREV